MKLSSNKHMEFLNNSLNGPFESNSPSVVCVSACVFVPLLPIIELAWGIESNARRQMMDYPKC